MNFLSNLSKKVVVFILFIFLSASIISTIAYFYIQNSLSDLVVARDYDFLQITQKTGADVVDANLRQIKHHTRMARNSFILYKMGSSENTNQQILARLSPDNYLLGFCYLTKDNAICTNESFTDYFSYEWLANTSNDQKAKILNPFFVDTDEYLLPVVTTINVPDEGVGVFVAIYNAYCLSAWTSEAFSHSEACTSYIVDSDYYNIANSKRDEFYLIRDRFNSKRLKDLHLPNGESINSVYELEKRALEGQRGIGSYTWDGELSYLSYGPLKEAPWGFYLVSRGKDFAYYYNNISNVGYHIGLLPLFSFVCVALAIILLILRILAQEHKYASELLEQKNHMELQAEKIAASEEKFRIAMGQTKDLILDYHVKTHQLSCFMMGNEYYFDGFDNPAVKTDLVGAGFVLDDESFAYFKQIFATMINDIVCSECLLYAYKDNSERCFKLKLTDINDANGNIVRVVGCLKDITRERNSYLDPLTKLHNKTAITKQIRTMLSSSKYGTFVMIDIDDFKHVNDTYGHLTGDHVIMSFAQVIQNVFQEDFISGRLGGDEFCVVCARKLDESYLKNKLQEFCEAINAIKHEGNSGLSVSCSCGATFMRESDTFEMVYQRADEAMYDIKHSNKNSFKIIS